MVAATAEEVLGGGRRASESGSEPSAKPLGLLWVYSSHPVVALGLERVLEQEAEVHVGRRPPEGRSPTSVMLCLTGVDGLVGTIEHIREACPRSPILAFALEIDPLLGKTAFKAGVRGFIHGRMQPEQIIKSVSLAASGEVVVPAELLENLVAEEDLGGKENLTSRQREILALVAQGMTNAQIAKRLYLSEFTIKQHLRAAYKLLGVKNRTEASRLFRKESDAEESEREPGPSVGQNGDG